MAPYQSSFASAGSMSKPAKTHEPRFRTWISAESWRERIVSFNASWFVATMGTGVVMQVLADFPYPAQWLADLAYCFWILDMVLFVFFTVLSIIRSLFYPHLTRAIFLDFAQTSYLGAIPVTVGTVTQGLVRFHSDRFAAIWTAYGLWWIAVAMSALIGIAVVFVVSAYQKPKQLESVTAVWLVSFIPFIVTSAVGGYLAPHLNDANATLCLVVSFLCWGLGISFCAIITSIYFWRLVACSLPAREAIVSCFIPMGPTAMGAYALQNMAAALAYRIRSVPFTIALTLPASLKQPHPDLPLASLQAISQSMHWAGIIGALLGVSLATFFLLFALAACITKVPRQFNVGFWAFVFPCGAYSLALSTLATSLRDEGFRGYAAGCTVLTCLLWLGCALATLYKGVWCAELFFAPGLEGWNERRMLNMVDEEYHDNKGDDGEVTGEWMKRDRAGRTQHGSNGDRQEERWSRPDGTYCVARRRQEQQHPPDSRTATEA